MQLATPPPWWFTPGTSPLLVSVPHAGTWLPAGLATRLSPQAAALPDTDWFVDRLYAFASELGAGLLVASRSRYVIDLNRPPDDAALYATRTTALVPLETFDGAAVYRAGEAPDADEVRRRRVEHWDPYHARLASALDALKALHGHAVLLDAHSIRSQVPALFEGRLPAFNLGSNGGSSAAPGLVALAATELGRAPAGFDLVVDGRFRGGHITRHHGRPAQGVHALQLEMAQRAYMDEASGECTARSMARVQAVLRRLLRALADWRPA